MYEYVPAHLPAGRPLVVVLHGCSQTADGMVPAGWNAVADQYQFAVVYPQQRVTNQLTSCFNWYDPPDMARVGGEPESVVQMIDYEVAHNGVDRDRVYVTGMSAGGAFTAVMLATYPDRFAAGSIMSGTPYGCATDAFGASGCLLMTASTQRTAAQWGDLVRFADPDFTGTYPRVQIWQGLADLAVNPEGATEIVKQWTNVWGTDATADATDTISATTRTRYMAGTTVAVERYMVENMGHAIAVGDDALGTCPAVSGFLFDEEQICSTLHAADFFGLLQPASTGSDAGPDAALPVGSVDAGTPNGNGNGDGATAHSGGCSTSGGSGLGLVLAMMLLRRRRQG